MGWTCIRMTELVQNGARETHGEVFEWRVPSIQRHGEHPSLAQYFVQQYLQIVLMCSQISVRDSQFARYHSTSTRFYCIFKILRQVHTDFVKQMRLYQSTKGIKSYVNFRFIFSWNNRWFLLTKFDEIGACSLHFLRNLEISYRVN